MADEKIVDSEVYDAGEHRLHYQHAAEAHAFAARADAFRQMADGLDRELLTAAIVEQCARYRRIAAETDVRAQWHATMALYEASVPGRDVARDAVDRAWREGYEQCLRDISVKDRAVPTTDMLAWLADMLKYPQAAARAAQ